MPTITPFLWFDNNAEEAMNLYAEIFKDSKIGNVSRYPEGGPAPAGSVMTAEFELCGQKFIALNGGPNYKFNEAVSLFVSLDTQEEVDDHWEKLTADGGEPGPCGWLKDKFGLSWQIIPKALTELMGDSNPAKSQAVMQAMMQMQKIDIAALQTAHDQAA